MKHSDRQLQRARKARDTYSCLGYPSLHDCKNIIKLGSINNCDVTLEDIKAAEDTFGPDVCALKGKTVRKSQCQH